MATITGGSGNDSLTGTSAGDELFGFAGNDTLNGAGGADTMNGGAHSDVYIVDNSGDLVIEAEGGGADDSVFSSVSYTLPSWVNHLTLTGTQSIDGAGNELANRLTGNAGYNRLSGGAGDDTIEGIGDLDELDGGAGNDSLIGAGHLRGGDGNDTLRVSGGSFNHLFGGGGNDLLIGGEGTDYLRGGAGNDTIRGNGGNDLFELDLWAIASGDYGHDEIYGGSGTDRFWFAGDAQSAMVIDFRAGTITGGGAGGSGSIVFTSVENVTGSDFGDLILGDGKARHLDGAGGDDTIRGGSGAETIWGGTGKNELRGGGGNDTIVGSDEDSVYGGSGDDFIYLGGALIHGGTGVDIVSSGDWQGDAGMGVEVDLREGSYQSVTLRSIEGWEGGARDDMLTGNARANVLYGMGGSDTLTGGAGNDTLRGDNGADQFVFDVAPGAANADVILDFQSGVDKLVFDAGVYSGLTWSDLSYDSASGGLRYHGDLVATLRGAPVLGASDIEVRDPADDGLHETGTSADDELSGTSRNDRLEGLGGRDTLRGFAGDDTLDGGGGKDVLRGGRGDDVYVVTHGDRIFDSAGTDTVVYQFDHQHNWTLGADLEVLVLKGHTDGPPEGLAPSGTGNALDNVIRVEGTFHSYITNVDGAGGDDTLLGSVGSERFTFVAGGENYGNDFVDGGGGRDFIYFGTAGSAAVVDIAAGVASGGGTGSVTFVDVENAVGGSFDDRLVGDSARNELYGSSGNDTLIGGGGDDSLFDDRGIPELETADDNDRLSGGDGNDFIEAGRGDDSLSGGAGDDRFWLEGHADYGNDTIRGGSGVDEIMLSSSHVTVVDLRAGTMTSGPSTAIVFGIENFTFSSFTASIDLAGNAAANVLTGSNGADTLDGGAGNDTLDGQGWAWDTSVVDSFAFSVAPGAANADVVLGFLSGTDRILLDRGAHSGIGARGALSDARFYAAPGAASGHDADDRVVYDMSSGRLYYDADGSGAGAAQLIATLLGQPALQASDISVV